MPGIRVFWVERSTGRTSEAAHPDVDGLLARDDGWLWLDIPDPDEQTAEQLTSSFGFHARAVHGRDGTGARAALNRGHPHPPPRRRRSTSSPRRSAVWRRASWPTWTTTTRTHPVWIIVLVVIMVILAAMWGVLLRWAKRQGWW